MDRIEAMTLLSEIKHYLTTGNPVWDVDEIAEALDMAIEALRNEINCVKCQYYTERETYTGIKGVCKMDTAHREDIISRSRAIKDISYWATNIIDPKMLVKEDALYILESLPSAETPTVSEKHQLSEETSTDTSTDLISRQAAIRWVKTECNPYGKPTLDFESGKRVMEHLAQMPTAEPKTGWIPVSERLPSESGNYLITVADLRLGHNGEHTVTMADFYAKAKKWNSIVDVYAWMPLPEPYRKEREE